MGKMKKGNTLATASLVTCRSFSRTISIESSIESFWEKYICNVKRESRSTTKYLCSKKEKTQTWLLSISAIKDKASSLVDESESSNTSSTAVKI
jgi:hypothetical protein